MKKQESAGRVRRVRSSGNAFRDLGFTKTAARHLKVRADLLIAVQEAIAARNWTQVEAAGALGIHQPRVSDLMRGRMEVFSIETLIEMLSRLGVDVGIVVSAR